MRTSNRSSFMSAVWVVGLALTAGACSIDINLGGEDIDGSGDIETRTYDVAGFDEISIQNALEADVTVSPGAEISVEVTADDNFFEYITIDVSSSTLKAKTEDDVNLRGERLVTVVVPSLSRVDASGATSVNVDAGGTNVGAIDVSGASTLGILDLNADDIDIDVSGASNVAVAGDKIDSVTADVSGASSADLHLITVGDATVDVSGASHARFGEADRVVGDASGASNVRVESDTDVDIDTSGASSVDRG